jgi:hypothetical protein
MGVFGWLQADTVAAVWTAAAAIHREKNTVEAAAAAGLQPQQAAANKLNKNTDFFKKKISADFLAGAVGVVAILGAIPGHDRDQCGSYAMPCPYIAGGYYLSYRLPLNSKKKSKQLRKNERTESIFHDRRRFPPTSHSHPSL